MNFKNAYEALKQGKKIKREHWAGYWHKENNTIIMHCKDGLNIPFLETKDLFFTIDNMIVDDWIVVENIDTTNLNISTFTFGEAVYRLKRGEKVSRKGWNGNGMFVVYQKGYPQGIPCNEQTAKAWGLKQGDLFICNPYLQIKCVNGSHSMWVPSINDILSDDWFKVEDGEQK